MGFWIFQICHRLDWGVWSIHSRLDSHLIIEVTPSTSPSTHFLHKHTTLELLTFPVYPVYFCSFSFMFFILPFFPPIARYLCYWRFNLIWFSPLPLPWFCFSVPYFWLHICSHSRSGHQTIHLSFMQAPELGIQADQALITGVPCNLVSCITAGLPVLL